MFKNKLDRQLGFKYVFLNCQPCLANHGPPWWRLVNTGKYTPRVSQGVSINDMTPHVLLTYCNIHFIITIIIIIIIIITVIITVIIIFSEITVIYGNKNRTVSRSAKLLTRNTNSCP